MTISTDTATASYTGNGTTTAFPIPFYFLVDTDVKISKKDGATGTISVLTLNSDYTLTGAGNQAGGTATMTVAPLGGTTPDQLFIERNVDAVQETAYPENGIFPAASHEKALDRLTMLVQQILSKLTFGLFRNPLAATYDLGGNTLSNVADAVNAQDVPSLVQTQTLVASATTGIVPSLIVRFTDLIASAGSSLISFLQLGTHAVARTLQDRGRDVYNVKDAGAKCDGTTDDTTAFQNALNDVSALGGGMLTLPAGRIKLGAITLPSNVSIRGAGKYNTWIVPAGAQTCFTLAGGGSQIQQTYSDFGIDCGSTASVNGFKFTNCLNVGLYRIAFKGCVSNFEIDQGYYYDIDGCDSIGTAALKAGSCKVWSSDDTKYVFQVGLRRYTVNNIGNGVQGPVVYVRRGVAVQLHQVNCNDANVGGAVDFIVIENDCQGCKIQQSGCGASTRGLLVQTGSGVSVAPSFLDVISCDFDQSNTSGISIGNGYNISVIGGNITTSGVGTTGSGVLVSHASAVRVHGVTINGFSGTNGAGIYVDGTGSTSHVELRGNHIENCYYGLVMANSPTNVSAYGNVLRSCANKLNGSLSGTGNVFANNPGFNPITISAPAVPTSGATVTNTIGVPVRVFIVGGTVSSVVVNGSAVGIGSVNFNTELNPGETIVINYSAAPTWVWSGK